MKNLIYNNRPFLLIAILAIIFPLVVNYLSEIPAYHEIFSQPSIWLMFWGTYSAAIASFGMIFITSRSIKQSSIENLNNRQLQIRTIEYQTKLEWISKITQAIVKCNTIYNFSKSSKFVLLANASNNARFNDIIEEEIRDSNTCKFEITTLLYGNEDSNSKELLETVSSFSNRFLNFLFDLEFFFGLSKTITSDELKIVVEKYKSNHLKNAQKGTTRIWDIIADIKYSFNSENQSMILNYLIREYHFEEFEAKCFEFVKYEKEQAKKILNGTK